MKRSIHVLALAFAGAQLATGTSVAAQNRRPALDAEARVEVVEQLAVLLGERYVFAAIGRNYATMLERNLQAGRYEDLIAARSVEDLVAAGVGLEVIVYEGGEHLLSGIDFWPDVTVWLDRKVQ